MGAQPVAVVVEPGRRRGHSRIRASWATSIVGSLRGRVVVERQQPGLAEAVDDRQPSPGRRRARGAGPGVGCLRCLRRGSRGGSAVGGWRSASGSVGIVVEALGSPAERAGEPAERPGTP